MSYHICMLWPFCFGCAERLGRLCSLCDAQLCIALCVSLLVVSLTGNVQVVFVCFCIQHLGSTRLGVNVVISFVYCARLLLRLWVTFVYWCGVVPRLLKLLI